MGNIELEEKPLNIMFVSHTFIGGPFVVGSHHLARELSKRGHRVLHMSTAITPMHLFRIGKASIKSRFRQWLAMRNPVVDDAIIHCVPFTWVPWNIAGRAFRWWGRNWFVSWMAFPRFPELLKTHRFQNVDLLLIDQPYFVGIDKYVNAKLIVYRPTDNYKEMIGDDTIEWAERNIVGKAHCIVATSAPVYRNIKKLRPELPGMIMENGVEFGHFSAYRDEPEEFKGIPSPRAIYVGAVDERLDVDAIRKLADERPAISVIVIGPCSPSMAALSSINLHFLGAKPYDRLPCFLHHADLALLPMSGHAANAGRSPMKLYEYAAAGLPTVVTATAELVRRPESFLYFYRETHELIEQVDEVLRLLAANEISTASIVDEARKHSWESKVDQLLRFRSTFADKS
ncbi:glycosyltransferase [Cohnella soli]|uniref:Glycosyltransferase n=1 Tax=Cohnella soli TaxID=425005 RepID=A0ABW0HWW9_9BACL